MRGDEAGDGTVRVTTSYLRSFIGRKSGVKESLYSRPRWSYTTRFRGTLEAITATCQTRRSGERPVAIRIANAIPIYVLVYHAVEPYNPYFKSLIYASHLANTIPNIVYSAKEIPLMRTCGAPHSELVIA